MRREYDGLIRNPPPGYEFIARPTVSEGIFQRMSRWNCAYSIHHWLNGFLPTGLVKAYWERRKTLPRDTALTYAVFHPVFRRQPWIMDMQPEQPYLMAGSERVFARWQGPIKRAFLSDYCRRVICQMEAAKGAFLQGLDCPELEGKTAIVNLAVPGKHFTKAYRKDKVKLLFVNSANINTARHFQTHGGLVLLEVFDRLCRRYDNLELVIRSGLPQALKERLSRYRNILVYDEIIPWPQLEAEFQSADIFVYPTLVTPAAIFLDAMSYELPIATTDVWGNPEIVADGKTGIIVPHPMAREFTDGFIVHFDAPEFKRALTSVPDSLVADMVERIALLIENPDLRRRMGEAGRREVEHGKFSMAKRNEALKRILDEATAGSG